MPLTRLPRHQPRGLDSVANIAASPPRVDLAVVDGLGIPSAVVSRSALRADHPVVMRHSPNLQDVRNEDCRISRWPSRTRELMPTPMDETPTSAGALEENNRHSVTRATPTMTVSLRCGNPTTFHNIMGTSWPNPFLCFRANSTPGRRRTCKQRTSSLAQQASIGRNSGEAPRGRWRHHGAGARHLSGATCATRERVSCWKVSSDWQAG